MSEFTVLILIWYGCPLPPCNLKMAKTNESLGLTGQEQFDVDGFARKTA